MKTQFSEVRPRRPAPHLLLITLLAALSAAQATAATAATAGGLVWDADVKETNVAPGVLKANFQFWFTNTSPNEVLIQSARSSCFCTVAKLPSEPWAIPAGASRSIDVTMDLSGKRGSVSKPVNVVTSAGTKSLAVRANIPFDTAPAAALPGATTDEQRIQNTRLAAADRQVVFKKAECAECHAKPARGHQNGARIYAGVCATCHDSEHRASTVPDLNAVARGKDADYWRNWIAYGRPGTMMPAFAEAEGGPLSEQQIDALARHLASTLPGATAPAGNARNAVRQPNLPLSESVSEFPLPPAVAH